MIYTLYLTVYYLITIGLIYYYFVFLYKYIFIGVSKVFDEKIIWDKYVDKPRLLIYMISATYIWLAFDINKSTNSIQAFSKLIMLFTSILFVWLSNTNAFIKSLEYYSKQLNRKSNRTKLIIQALKKEDVDYILNEFKKYKICSDDISEDEFLNALKFNQSSNGIILSMNNSSIKFFHKHLFKHFDLSLNLKTFLSSKSFLNKKGQEYNYNSVKNSVKTLPNYKQRLKDIFDNLPSKKQTYHSK